MTSDNLTPEKVREVTDYVNDLYEMIAHTGRHADHDQEQVGRCLYCSCGKRAQTGEHRHGMG